MSMMLPAKMISRFHIATSPEDIKKYIAIDAVPKGYGGNRTFPEQFLPTGYNLRKELTKDDFIVGFLIKVKLIINLFQLEGQVWQKHKITPPYETHYVSDSFLWKMQVKKGQTFVFEYLANRNFEVSLIKG
jgi:hypothetical protein